MLESEIIVQEWILPNQYHSWIPTILILLLSNKNKLLKGSENKKYRDSACEVWIAFGFVSHLKHK